jgi:hypothetical protein
MDLIEFAVEGNHLAIESLEGAEAEITVIPELADGDRALVDPLDQRPRGRDLEQRRVIQPQRIRQRPRDEMTQRLSRRLAARHHGVQQGLIDLDAQCRHGLPPPSVGRLCAPLPVALGAGMPKAYLVGIFMSC